MNFGVLTLATPNDYLKAIGLALSLRVSNPGIPIAVACPPQVRARIAPYFDHVIDENPSLRGFIHKLHLDRYSPFQETFFFDSDVLVFRTLAEALPNWRGQPYTACGNYVVNGISAFGLDRAKVLRVISRDKLVHIDGAGHAYFRKPDCHAAFDLARSIAANYQEYAGNIPLADEDVMDIVMTILQLTPIPHGEFWSRYCSGKKGTMVMNVAKGICQFEAVATGRIHRPHMMHFAYNEAPFVYTMQLRRLFRKFNVSTRGLLDVAIRDYYLTEVKWPLKKAAKLSLQKLGCWKLNRSSLS
jgi:hypothetical protein